MDRSMRITSWRSACLLEMYKLKTHKKLNSYTGKHPKDRDQCFILSLINYISILIWITKIVPNLLHWSKCIVLATELDQRSPCPKQHNCINKNNSYQICNCNAFSINLKMNNKVCQQLKMLVHDFSIVFFQLSYTILFNIWEKKHHSSFISSTHLR